MNIKVRFKENICWSTHIIGENNLNNCLAILQHGVKNSYTTRWYNYK